MPVDIVVGAGGSQTVTVWNDARLQWFFLPMPASVTSVEFDPNEWILRTGATLVNYIPGAARIHSTEPHPGDDLLADQDVNEITINFTTSINAAPSDFTVVGEATGPVSFTSSALTNVSTVRLFLDEPLAIDTYTVTISDAVETVTSGLPLDGEISYPPTWSALPSGDGLPGGEAVFHFSVRAPVVPAASDFGAMAAALLVLATGALAMRSRGRRAVAE